MIIKYKYKLLLCLLLSSTSGYSQYGETSIEIDAFSKYIWRDFINDFIVIQPSIDYAFPKSNFNLNLWLSFNVDADYVPIESSTTLYYSSEIKNVIAYDIGFVHYSGYDETLYFFDLPIHNWMELYGAISAYDIVLSPSIELYYHDMTGIYATLGLDHTFKWLSLNTAFLTGYRAASTFDDNGLREAGLSISVPFHIKSFEYALSVTHMQFPTQHTSRTFLGLNISLP